MAACGSTTLPTIGFYTVTEDTDLGFVGGLLVLNVAGRPLEFHCTAPLRPNRAQEILYGPTLRPFLFGEQIGVTLATKARSDTLFLCTDVEPAMCLRETVTTPLVLIRSAADAADSRSATGPLAAAGLLAANAAGAVGWIEANPAGHHSAGNRLTEFTLGSHTAAVLTRHAADREAVEARWRPFAGELDLQEPFGRIRSALEEAQRGAAK